SKIRDNEIVRRENTNYRCEASEKWISWPNDGDKRFQFHGKQLTGKMSFNASDLNRKRQKGMP
ncbi:MAG: hypothetical protein ACFFCH_07425, partial [Promethearchaeota archaeon]